GRGQRAAPRPRSRGAAPGHGAAGRRAPARQRRRHRVHPGGAARPRPRARLDERAAGGARRRPRGELGAGHGHRGPGDGAARSPGVNDAPLRVLLVDNHPIVREGIRALLEGVSDLEVVGEAGSGVETLARARALAPDVVLVDLVMPGMAAAELIRRLRAEIADARVLVLTTFSDARQVRATLAAGAIGYLLKDVEG